MTNQMIRHVSLAIALVLSGCSYEIPEMTPEQANNIERLTARMTTRCIGRYLVDLPEAFVLNTISRTEIENTRIQVIPTAKRLFNDALSRRESLLRNTHMDGEPIKPFLKSALKLPNNDIGKIFNRAEKTGASEIARTLELFAWKDGYRIEISVNATDGSDYKIDESTIGTPFEASERSTWEKYRHVNDAPQKLAHVLNLYDRLSGRNDHEIPTEQGVCFPNGFLRGAPTDSEWIDLNYHLSSAEDVYFRFISLSDIGPQENTLLERGREINAMLDEVNGRTLRKGARNENGQEFEEWLMMRESDPGVKDYHLTLEMNSEEGNASSPFATLTMSSGVRKPGPTPSLEEAATRKPIQKATLGEAESVALWDRVTETLRPRPGAF